MGLDMYLEKETYIPHDKREKLSKENINYDNVKPERVSKIIEQIAYWRKANQIHQWFVTNVQNGVDDCGRYYLDINKLKTLLIVVNEVLENPREFGPKRLPTTSGFFFGSTEYGNYYLEDLQYTKKTLEQIISESDLDNFWISYYYHSSW